jgi:5-methylcytosine-specific restriction endonuclease McrA
MKGRLPVARTMAERREQVYRRVGGCCTYCGRALHLHEAHLDHELGVHAVAEAPDEELQCACADCRTDKGERTGAEYRQLRRYRHAQEMLATLAAR